MNEKFVKVEVFVDTTNPEQLGALGAFLSTVGGVTVPIPVQEKSEPTEPEIPATPVPGKKRGPKPKTQPEPEAQSEPEAEPAEPEAEPTKPAEEKVYKIEEVREKLKEKVSDHREEIKAKLTELGAPNVSNLDVSKYAEFVEFLESL